MKIISAKEALIVIGLARVAASNPGALRLAVQLLGAPACPKCDFRKEFCRC